MHPIEVEAALKTLTVIVDTREQETPLFKERIKAFPLWQRQKLNAGDYSAKVLANGGWVNISAAVERKMSIDELCYCYCHERDRFEREFNRAKESGIKLYMLIEGCTWEKIYRGFYASKMRPKSLVGSILSWLARYDCQILFCAANTSGKLIFDVMYYEARTFLLNYE
jgi:ERCC4-type nuclease